MTTMTRNLSSEPTLFAFNCHCGCCCYLTLTLHFCPRARRKRETNSIRRLNSTLKRKTFVFLHTFPRISTNYRKCKNWILKRVYPYALWTAAFFAAVIGLWAICLSYCLLIMICSVGGFFTSMLSFFVLNDISFRPSLRLIGLPVCWNIRKSSSIDRIILTALIVQFA